jgi:hypothetical protein
MFNRKIQILVAISVFTFVLQFTSISFLHNHDLDLDHHYDCPAFVLSTTFISFIFTILFIFDTKLPYTNFFIPKKSTQKNLSIIISCLRDRAPPF